MFIPEHYAYEEWQSYAKNGYRLNRFLVRPINVINQMNAADYLATGWEEMFQSGDERGSGCCLASIIFPEKEYVVRLKCDEDYFYITKSCGTQVINHVQWQFSKRFHGFRLDELWMNMINAKDTKLQAITMSEFRNLW